MFNNDLKSMDVMRPAVLAIIWAAVSAVVSMRADPVVGSCALTVSGWMCIIVYFGLTDWVWSADAFRSGLHPHGRHMLREAHCLMYDVSPNVVEVYYNPTFQVACSGSYCTGGEKVDLTGIDAARIQHKKNTTTMVTGVKNTHQISTMNAGSAYSVAHSDDLPPRPPPIVVDENPKDITQELASNQHVFVTSDDPTDFVYAQVNYSMGVKGD